MSRGVTWPAFCFRGVILAALLRIDCSGGSGGKETREEATAISRQERMVLDQRAEGRGIGFWTYFQVESTGFALGWDIRRRCQPG